MSIAKVETRGRPMLPENQLKILNTELEKLKAQLAEKNSPLAEIKELAETIRLIQRAVNGQEAEDDNFSGLINVNDIRERTRLDETALLSHSAMRTIANLYPELDLYNDIAEMEDPYYISQDGLGRTEAISTINAKTRLDNQNLINVNTGANQTGAEGEQKPTQPPKKNFIQKLFKR